MKFEIGKYNKAVQWVREILWQTKFTAERLKVGTGKLLTDIPSYKRKGDHIAKAVLHSTNFDSKKSNHSTCIFLRQQSILSSLNKRLKSKTSAPSVVREMEELRAWLCNPKNLRIQVVSNLKKLKDAKKPWISSFLPANFSTQEFLSGLEKIKFASEHHNPSTSKGNTGYITSTGAIESAFLIQSAQSPKSFADTDLAPLMVCTEYLTALEGPFWKQIRGLGLAYGSYMYTSVEDGFVYFGLSRSTNVGKAYQAAQDIVNDFVNRKTSIDEIALESARSTVIYEIVQREETVESAANQAFMNYLRGVDPSYNRQLLKKVQQVSADDVHRVLEKYIKTLFDTKSSNISIALNPSKAKDVIQEFESMNRNLKEVSSLEKFFQES